MQTDAIPIAVPLSSPGFLCVYAARTTYERGAAKENSQKNLMNPPLLRNRRTQPVIKSHVDICELSPYYEYIIYYIPQPYDGEHMEHESMFVDLLIFKSCALMRVGLLNDQCCAMKEHAHR